MDEKMAFARSLRKAATRTERIVWRWLRDRRFLHAKFRRQHVVGPFVLDFYSHDLRLAVEVDGDSHIEEEQRFYDKRREAYLVQHGIAVVRITNDLIAENPTAAADQIAAAVELRRR